MSINPKHLIGRRIVAVDMRPFKTGPRGHERTCHDPCVTLDDGSVLTFAVEETEEGASYGVDIVRQISRCHR